MRNDLKAELDERDYAKEPLDTAALRELFKGRYARDFLNTKSPTFKKMALQGKTLTADQAIKLMAQEPNLIKRPLTIVDGEMITGADDLVRALTGDRIGRTAAVDVLRGAERLTLSLTPAERKRAA